MQDIKGGAGSLDLLVIIVSWNTRALLLQCLESVYRDLGTLRLASAEICIVDNASTDGSAQAVRNAFPLARVIENIQNVGFAAANNQAIRACPAQAYLLLNSDTLVRPGALQRLLETLNEHPGAGACGPRLLNPDGSFQPSGYPMLTPGRELWRLLFLDKIIRRASYPMRTWPFDQSRSVEVLTGACLLLRGAALDEIGLLDENYFMYTEEVDLCYRLAQRGWKVRWEPRAEVIHLGGASSARMAEAMYAQLYHSKAQFFRKLGGEREATRFKRYLALAYWPRYIFSSLGAPVSPALAAHAATFRCLLRELPSL